MSELRLNGIVHNRRLDRPLNEPEHFGHTIGGHPLFCG